MQRSAQILLATGARQSGAGCLDHQYAQAMVDAFADAERVEANYPEGFLAALDEADRILFVRPWTPWRGVHKVKDGPQDHELYGSSRHVQTALWR